MRSKPGIEWNPGLYYEEPDHDNPRHPRGGPGTEVLSPCGCILQPAQVKTVWARFCASKKLHHRGGKRPKSPSSRYYTDWNGPAKAILRSSAPLDLTIFGTVYRVEKTAVDVPISQDRREPNWLITFTQDGAEKHRLYCCRKETPAPLTMAVTAGTLAWIGVLASGLWR